MPKIETVYCAKCGAANQGYEREDGAAMVLQTNGKYENSNIAGCSSCQKYPTGVVDGVLFCTLCAWHAEGDPAERKRWVEWAKKEACR
jgi:hypothetical protein